MEILREIGFSEQDILLIALCPVFAMLGGLVHFVLLNGNFDRKPRKGRIVSPGEMIARTKWMVDKFIVSAVSGLVLALYFVGALVQGPTIVARVLAFSILLGYVSHKLWGISEKAILQMVEDKFKALTARSKRGET